MMVPGPLAGIRVVVTRAQLQAPELSAKLLNLGADVVEVPTIEIVDPDDGGEALREALARIDSYAWLVVTSTNGAARLCREIARVTAEQLSFDRDDLAGGADNVDLRGVAVAAVGSATAEVLGAHGINVDLVPSSHVAEALLEDFPAPATGEFGGVLLARAAVGRDVLPDRLRDLGWRVDVVEAYRTVPVTLTADQVSQAAGADVVTFTSPSTVDRFVAEVGLDRVPPLVACIGPVTADAAERHGVVADVVAEPHTIDGLVTCLAAHLAGRRTGDT